MSSPSGVTDDAELLRRRAIDPLSALLALGVAAVVVLYLLALPGTALWVFVATAAIFVLVLALSMSRVSRLRRAVAARPDAPAESVVVSTRPGAPAFRRPALLLQRTTDGLRFASVSEPGGSTELELAGIRSIVVTAFPAGIAITRADGERIALRVLTPRLSGPRPADLPVLRDWLRTGARFPAELGVERFRSR